MKALMLSCKAATELMEKKLEQGLSLRQRFQLWMHTLICDACKQYEKQSRQIDTFLKKKFEAPADPSELNVDTEGLKEKIRERLGE